MTDRLTEQIVFRAAPDLTAWLADRDTRAMGAGSKARARTELQLWRAVLTEELARMTWTLPELAVIAQTLNGTILPDGVGHGGNLLAWEVADAVAPDPGPQLIPTDWGVDTGALVERLEGLGLAADLALMDAVSRWWADGDREHTAEGWARVGVRVVEG